MKQRKHALTPAERWEQATLANNFIFCKVMTENKELCKQLLEILLHIKIDHIESPVAEKSIKVDFDSRGIRFDVYTKGDGRVFDIEVQTTNRQNLPQRARYYQSIMDADNLQTGDDYESVKESYVIFLCLDDVFKKGLPVYTFENVCLEDMGIKLGDKAYKIFFNAEKCDIMPTGEERAFFRLLRGKNAETDFTRRISTEVIRAKHNTQWRMQFMTWEQSIREEAKIRAVDMAQEMAEELAQEIAERKAKELAERRAGELAEEIAEKKAQKELLDTARRMLATGKLTAEEIADAFQLPVADIQAAR